MKGAGTPDEFRLLKLLDRIAPLFVRLGADYPVMRSIVEIKLTMDRRRTPTVLAGMGKERSEQTGTGFIQWIYVLYGALFSPLLLLPMGDMAKMAMMFGVLMFFIMTTLISDFSSVMLDLRDKSILLARPVSGRTVGLAKTIHILVYLAGLSFSLAGPGLLLSLFREGIAFFLLFAAGVVLADALVLVLTGLLYLLILKVFDGEKLKDMINYVQIGLSIVVMIGYQLVSRLFNMTAFSGGDPDFGWWQVLVPPFWFGSAFEVVLGGERRLPFVLLTAAALVIPAVLCAVYIRTLPAFERGLQKLAAQESAGHHRSRYSDLLARALCRSREERLFFGFSWAMMRTERDFKLKVYPTLGLSIIFPFIFMANYFMDGNLDGLRDTKAYLYIYFTALMLQTVLSMLSYSVNYKAAWIYKAVPLPELRRVYSASFKAALCRLVLPLFLVDSVIFTVIFGVRIVPDLAAALLTLLIYTVICHLLQPQSLPFSERYERNRQKEKQWNQFGLMLILGAFAGLHYAVSLTGYGIYPYLALLAAAVPIVWRQAFGRSAGNRLSAGLTEPK